MQLKYCTLRFCTVSLQALEIKQVAGSARPGISTIVMAPSARVNPNANITGQTGHIDDMSEMYGSEHDSWNSDYSDGSIVASQPGSLPPKALADSLSALTIPIHDPAFFFTLKGFINLVVAPFFQGMFHGLGEGIARILVGRWVGIDPLTALAGRRRDVSQRTTQSKEHPTESSFLARWFKPILSSSTPSAIDIESGNG
ncbi:hypothetical protein BASA50_010623 [Batrachochytrium salamandrivorans]|uniref:Uncharacterized protein n=1 Tax=Batrachochytrium salamandrivorans TaxID=1357716 RepID=A0ABQ8F0V3_9FUNG|nr:hypothetical protein BASA60_001206 [Batrachochytrium salamandrivorans]KAH6588661.1 hypothetical protein BASA50_010623 [Batrachochytrium salamandrivorans]KAH6602686.1 hypothetical protein BASA61_000851 [Batrachochytrium salamandrivorans]KAJ1343645.1 hypothetical protein BSLG_001793 [Batrachochytrium salamandrivorans]